MPAGSASRLALKLAAIVAVLFGIATVASGGSVLFGGGAYENRTLAAMTLRLVLWAAIAALALRLDLSQRHMRRA